MNTTSLAGCRPGGVLLCAAVLAITLTSQAAQDKEQVLFGGSDLNAWRPPLGTWTVVQSVKLASADATRLVSKPGTGVAVNGPDGRTVELVSKEEYDDAQVHVEFCIAKKSNSGVYLMGRYEVQIYDSFGVAKDAYPGIECGGIYPQWIDEKNVGGSSPRVNASKGAGEWQSFDITFRAPRFDASGKKIANACFLKVVHNGQVIHENVEVSGPTRAALWEDEKPLGPLRLQGDHGPVAYRNVRITPLNSK